MTALEMIWRGSMLLALISAGMFLLLIARRARAEFLLRRNHAAMISARLRVFTLLDTDESEFRRQTDRPDLFSKRELVLLNNLCIELCQVIKGAARRRVIDIMIHCRLNTDALHKLKRGSEDSRHAAAVALQYFDTPDSRQSLREALDDPSVEVSISAAHSLFELDALPPVDVLLETFTGRGMLQMAGVRTLFQKLATRMPDELIRAERIYPDETGIRVLIADAMGFSNDYSILPGLLNLAEDPAAQVRVRALNSLMRLEHPLAAETIARSLHDPEWEVRDAAVKATGELGMEEAIPVLEKLLESDNWMLRFDTALSLYSLGKAGRRTLLRNSARSGRAGRVASLVLGEKQVAPLLPGR